MKNIIGLILFLLPIGSFAQTACSVTVGVSTVGAGSSSGNSGFSIADAVTFANAGYVDTFNIYPKSSGLSLIGMMYTDNGGQPGTILGHTPAFNIPTANTWYQTFLTDQTVQVSANTKYWAVFQISTNGTGPAKDSVSWGRVFIASTFGTLPLSGSTWSADGGAKDSMFFTECSNPATPIPTLTTALPFRRNQVANPNVKYKLTGMLWVGDSYTAGTGAAGIQYCFVNQATTVFAGPGWFPGLTSTNQGTSGIDSASIAAAITTTVSTNYGNEPKTRFVLECGTNNLLHDVFQTAYTAGAENSFKADLNKCLACWYFYYPNTQAVVFTVPDLSFAGGVTNGGLGANGMDPAQWPTYTQWVAAFNAGVTAEAALFPGTQIEDMYTIMYGHPELYNSGALYHPNNAGHSKLAILAQNLFYLPAP